MTLSIGQILQGRYRILRQLGQGGMGAVYLAEDGRLGRRCAIKESVPDPTASPQALTQLRQQFQMEARTLAGLDHPNLTKVYDFFSDAGNEYLVMDYVDGQDLEAVLAEHQQKQGVPLPEKPVLIWADQVLDALECLHGQQPYPVIHRDIKPSNIVLTPQGKVKLVDFGLVKLLDPSSPTTASALRGMGTPEYTPLEQYPGSTRHTDPRSDLYALGATLYDLLTGGAPPTVSDRLLDPAKLTPPRQRNAALSAGTEAAIFKALEVYPDQRFQTAREMRAALAAQRGSPTALPQPVSPPPAPGRPFPWVKALGALIALLVIMLAAGQLAQLLRPGPGPVAPTSTVAAGLAIPATTAAIVQTPTPTASIVATETPTSSRTPTAPPASPTPTSAPTATSTPARIPTSTAPPASVPIATRTPAPAPAAAATSSYPAPVLVSPAGNATVSGRTTFTWQWSGPALAADQAFEVRIWREGQPDHYGAAEPTNSTRIEINLPAAYGVAQGGAGAYFWTVAVVQRNPYQRTGPEAPPRRLQVDFAGDAPPPLPTHLPPPP